MRVYTGDNGMGLALRPPTGLPQARTRIYRGANRSRGVGQATAPGGCLLEDAPLGCSPSGVPWQASGGGPANNWVYYDSITGQPLNLDDACYINDNLLVNCADTGDFGPQGSPQPAGPITILAQTPEYAAAVAAANAAYVPPPPPPPTQINPNASNPSYWDVQPNNPLAPAPSQALTPPATGTVVNPAAPGSGIAPGTVVNGTPTGGAATATCNGIGVGPCIGPLDAGTWGLIAAGALVLWMAMGTKK